MAALMLVSPSFVVVSLFLSVLLTGALNAVTFILFYAVFLFANLLDSLWKARPDERYRYFGIGNDRHGYWLLLNNLFSLMSWLDLFLIVAFTIALASAKQLPLLSSSGSLDVMSFLLICVLFNLVLFVSRNSLMNLLGQGYGTLGLGRGRVAEDSITGVASVARLAMIKLKQRRRRGVKYLSQSLEMLEQLLLHRGARLGKVGEVRTAVSFAGSYGTPTQFEPLEALSSDISLLKDPLPDLDRIGSLDRSITRYLAVVGWPTELEPVEVRPRSAYEMVTLAGIVLSTVGIAVGIIINLVVKPGVLTFLTIGSLSDGIALVGVVVIALLTYGLINRLSNTSVAWRDLLFPAAVPQHEGREQG